MHFCICALCVLFVNGLTIEICWPWITGKYLGCFVGWSVGEVYEYFICSYYFFRGQLLVYLINGWLKINCKPLFYLQCQCWVVCQGAWWKPTAIPCNDEEDLLYYCCTLDQKLQSCYSSDSALLHSAIVAVLKYWNTVTVAILKYCNTAFVVVLWYRRGRMCCFRPHLSGRRPLHVYHQFEVHNAQCTMHKAQCTMYNAQPEWSPPLTRVQPMWW